MLNIQIKPITNWPGTETKHPKSSAFKSGYKQTLEQLEKELAAIRADTSSIVLEMRISQHQLTLDGSRLRAHVKPEKAGIVLSFNRRISKTVNGQWVHSVQTLSYPCDAFDDWQDNLRAITLSLESLRRVERYGVFKYDDIVKRLSLPSADGKTTTKEEAAAFIATHSGLNRIEIMESPDIRADAFKRAAIKLHPDKETGSHEDFLKLQNAVKTLNGAIQL